MKISGFTIVRNANIMGYPIVESIQSVLPLVDEFIVGLGPCEDNTKELILGINSPKIKIIATDWNTKVPSGGQILSLKTNEALMHCSNDWCFYIQADEVLHEKDYPSIQSGIEKYGNNPYIEGLLFQYIHFYASYDVIATSRKWYRNEIRLVRKSSQITSWADAQGFRIHGRKPNVGFVNASIYHYGWVKPPKLMGEKKKRLDQLWHGNKMDSQNDQFDFKRGYGLRKFTGSHPAVMRERILNQDWVFDFRMRFSDWTLQDLNCLASDVFERIFRFRIGEYKSYKLLKS